MRLRGGPATALLLACLGPAHVRCARHTCAVAKEGTEIIFDCGGELISAVDFSSYGRPRGECDVDSVLMKKVANKHPLTDFHQAVDNAALRRPLLLARALLECVPVRKRISSTRNGACSMARTTVDAPAGASGPSPRKEATSSTTSPGSSSACGRRPVFHQW